VSVTVHVAGGGAPVKPTAVTCAATIGTKKLRGRPRAAKGSASCRYATPGSAKGKRLHGTISFTSRGTKITRRFATRLG
jgi:hypothetical protein